jgi:transposase-like protein
VTTTLENTKVCPRCLHRYPLDKFPLKNRLREKRHSWCNRCRNGARTGRRGPAQVPNEQIKKFGGHVSIAVDDKLRHALEVVREGRSFADLALEIGIDERAVWKMYHPETIWISERKLDEVLCRTGYVFLWYSILNDHRLALVEYEALVLERQEKAELKAAA